MFLGEKIGARSFAALLLGLGGITVLLLPDFASLGRAPLGAVITMGGAFGWAIGTLIQKHHRSEERRVGEEGRTRWWPDHLKKKKIISEVLHIIKKKLTPIILLNLTSINR